MTMRAGLASLGGLVVGEATRPTPGPGQVLVKVVAAGVNRADLNAAKGSGVSTAAGLGAPIGMEWAGQVEAVGEGVSALASGQWVACSGSGGYAEFAVCDAGRAIPFDPALLPAAEAAALPMALMTAHNALMVAGFKAGDTVLVHGASSGVGIAALQIASALGAGKVIGTARDPARRDGLKIFGAHAAIDPASPLWWQAVLEASGGHGADIIVDMVTGARQDQTLRAAALLGRVVNVGRLDGTRAEIDLDHHALRRLSFIGVTFRSRTAQEVRDIVAGVLKDVWPAVLEGEIRLPISSRRPLDEAPLAHVDMAANRHFGKIVLLP